MLQRSLREGGLPWWLNGVESTRQCRRRGWIPGLGSSPGEGNGNPLQCTCLGNLMDRRAWQAVLIGSQRVENGWVTQQYQQNKERMDVPSYLENYRNFCTFSRKEPRCERQSPIPTSKHLGPPSAGLRRPAVCVHLSGKSLQMSTNEFHVEV